MPSTTPALEVLGASRYVLVTTFRPDGTPMPTPVWGVREGDSLLIWTVRDSGKVKRIRRDATGTVAPCSFRGKPRGEPVPAQAEILDAGGTTLVRELIKKKYRLTGPLVVNGSLRRRGEQGSVGIRVTLRA